MSYRSKILLGAIIVGTSLLEWPIPFWLIYPTNQFILETIVVFEYQEYNKLC